MPGTTHLEHVDGTGHFSTDLHVLQQQNRVGNGGDVRVSDRMAAHELFGGVREEASDFFLLDLDQDLPGVSLEKHQQLQQELRSPRAQGGHAALGESPSPEAGATGVNEQP